MTIPIFAVDTFTVTNNNTEFEWYMDGSLAFGRPIATDTNSMSFLAKAYQAGLINSTMWSYTPSYVPDNGYVSGNILVGGYNDTDYLGMMLNWVPTPVNTATPDAWLA